MSTISTHPYCNCPPKTNHLNTLNNDWIRSCNNLFHATEVFNRSCKENEPSLSLNLQDDGSILILNSKAYSRAVIQNLVQDTIRSMQCSHNADFIPTLALRTVEANYQIKIERAENWRIQYELGPESKPFLEPETLDAAEETRDPSN